MAKKSEEQIWFEGVKKKLMKYISNEKWDYIELSDLYMSVVTAITSTEDVNMLSPMINERIVDYLFENIQNKFKKVRTGGGHSPERE